MPAKALRNFMRRIAADRIQRVVMRSATELHCDRRGGVTIYAALASAVLMGAAILAFDAGRITMIQTQMQNVADTAAAAASLRLDGRSGARERARFAAELAATVSDVVDAISDETPIVVGDIRFFRELVPVPVAATTDEEVRFVQVTMKPRPVKTILAPMMRVLIRGEHRAPARIGASSVAAADDNIQRFTLANWER